VKKKPSLLSRGSWKEGLYSWGNSLDPVAEGVIRGKGRGSLFRGKKGDITTKRGEIGSL